MHQHNEHSRAHCKVQRSYRSNSQYRRVLMQVGFVITVGNNVPALCISGNDGGNDGGDDGFAQTII